MFEGMRVGAVLPMGGEGRRFGSDLPKQFHKLNGRMVFLHALHTLRQSGLFDEIVLVCHADWMEQVSDGFCVPGGKTRQLSVFQGLKAFAKRPDLVVVHDAVRPFVTEAILRENVMGAARLGAVDTCVASTDTLVCAPDGQKIVSIPNRAEFFRGQTPQSFRMDWLWEAHVKALEDGIDNASDDCQLVARLGRPIYIVRGDERNMKITSALDLQIAHTLLMCQ